MQEVRQIVREHIVGEFLQGDATALASDEINLVESEVIDSLGIFLLVNFLQEQFGIEIDAEEVSIENFTTIDSISKLVTTKLAGD